MLFRSDRKSTRLNSSHLVISYAVFCLKKKKKETEDGLGALLRRGATQLLPSVSRPPRERHQPDRRGVSPPPPPQSTPSFFFFLNDRAPPELSPFPQPPLFPI